MASALSEALARKTNLESNRMSSGGGKMGREIIGPMESEEDESLDPVEDAMTILFPDIDKAEAAAAFRRACAACESEPEAEAE